MTLTLNLPPETEAWLETVAEQENLPVGDYVAHLVEEAMPKPKNGAEQLALLKAAGIVGMWKDREDIKDSAEFAHELRRQAETRTRD